MKFNPRLTAPSRDDKRFINYAYGGINTCIPIDSTGYVMPNCVGYAQGRLLELYGDTKANWKLPACNAEDWIDAALSKGFQTGKTPELGAVAVWRAGQTHCSSDGAGHVAIVEEILSNGDILVSQSAYGGENFYLTRISKTSGYIYSPSRPFMGFIYSGLKFETDDTKIKAGDKIYLSGEPCYTSETSFPYDTKYGTYYYWDSKIYNGRIRITNRPENVGVPGKVTCWIDVPEEQISVADGIINELHDSGYTDNDILLIIEEIRKKVNHADNDL